MIRIVIADDHPVVRAGLHAVLDVVDDIDVVGEAATPDEAVELAASLVPDLVLMDLRFGQERTGADATVKSHLVHVFSKLGVSSRTAAVAAAREIGILR